MIEIAGINLPDDDALFVEGIANGAGMSPEEAISFLVGLGIEFYQIGGGRLPEGP